MKTLLHISGFLILLGATLIGAPRAWVGVVGAVLLGLGIIGVAYARFSSSSDNDPDHGHQSGPMNLT